MDEKGARCEEGKNKMGREIGREEEAARVVRERMIERLGEGRSREACAKRKRRGEKRHTGEKGKAREKKKEETRAIPCATARQRGEGKRDGRTGRGLCDRGVTRDGRGAREQGGRGKGVDSLVTPAGNEQRGKGRWCRCVRGAIRCRCVSARYVLSGQRERGAGRGKGERGGTGRSGGEKNEGGTERAHARRRGTTRDDEERGGERRREEERRGETSRANRQSWSRRARERTRERRTMRRERGEGGIAREERADEWTGRGRADQKGRKGREGRESSRGGKGHLPLHSPI